MNDYIYFLICLLTMYFFVYLNNKKLFEFLVKQKINQTHGININELPKAGGILIIFFLLLNLDFYNQKFIYIFYIFCLTVVGLLGDLKKEIKYILRLLILFILLTSFLILNEEYIISQFQIYYIQSLIFSNLYFSFSFTLICLTVYLIGINFIDGINGNVFAYSLYLIFSILFFFNDYNIEIINIIIIPLIGYFFLNSIISKFFLGDNGCYLLGFIFATSLIILNNDMNGEASFKIGLLAFYPAFEVFFSIFRKIFSRKSPFKPDNLHLHSLLLKNINKYFLFNQNLNHLMASLIMFFIFHLPTMIIIFFINDLKFLGFYYIIFSINYLVFYLYLYKSVDIR